MNLHPVAHKLLALLETRKADTVNGISKWDHSLQSARLAQDRGWDADLVIMALLHDLAGGICPVNHGAVVAELLKPWLPAHCIHVLQVHEDYQLLNSHRIDLRGKHAHSPCHHFVVRFVDECDWPAFESSLVGKIKLDDFRLELEHVFSPNRWPSPAWE